MNAERIDAARLRYLASLRAMARDAELGTEEAQGFFEAMVEWAGGIMQVNEHEPKDDPHGAKARISAAFREGRASARRMLGLPVES